MPRRGRRRATPSFVDIAPLSHAFETFPATERMYTLMNHELVHSAQGDVADGEDRRWRRFFHGKVAPQREDPETLLYSYLTVPRLMRRAGTPKGARSSWRPGWTAASAVPRAATTRWCFGRWCATMPTSTTRWGSHPAEPKSTSRPARMPTCTARGSSRGSRTSIHRRRSSRGCGATREAHATTPTSSSRSSAFRSTRPGRVDRLRARVPTAQPGRGPPVSDHAGTQLTATAIGSISRMFFDESTGTIYAASAIPGFVEHVGTLNTRDGSHRALADIKRAMHYRVSSVACDSSSGTRLLHQRQPGD